MEGDALLLGGFLENFTFQSTPSVWRETSRRRTFPDSQQRISIHSLRMEGDAVYLADPVAIEEFQSTPSVWRETAQSIAINSDYKISIHSLRMEGDSTKRKQQELDRKISIHSLRMEGDYPAQPG